MDARALSAGVKPQHEADQSPPSGAEVKNAWNFISSPQYAFMVWCFIKNRDSFVFLPFICLAMCA
jgi:hypothetical protein